MDTSDLLARASLDIEAAEDTDAGETAEEHRESARDLFLDSIACSLLVIARKLCASDDES